MVVKKIMERLSDIISGIVLVAATSSILYYKFDMSGLVSICAGVIIAIIISFIIRFLLSKIR